MELPDLLNGIFYGIILGSIAGLLPGLHPNTFSQILSSINVEDGFTLAAIIIVSSAVNNIIALLPAIFLFIPDSDSVLSILPGQKLVLNGKGRLAVLVCALSAFLTLLFLIFVLPLSFIFLPHIFTFLKPYLAYILILFSAFFILQEKEKKIEAFFVFLLAGVFGYLVLSTSISSLLQESLFAVFIGFFSISSLFLSFYGNVKIPKQKDENYEIEISKKFILIIALSTLIGAASDIFPAINSPAQLATFISPFANSPLLFLSSTTSITVSHYANSLIAFERIGKTRTGTLSNIKDIIGMPTFNDLIFLILLYFVGTAIGIVILLSFSNLFLQFINAINKDLVNIILLTFLIISVLLFSGLFGLFICFLAAIIGIIPPLLGIRRTLLMSFLIIPSILILL